MKIEVKSPPEQELKLNYPVLMRARDDGKIVYFLDENRGVCLHEPESPKWKPTMEIEDDWVSPEDANIWSKFLGSLTLSN